MLPMWRAQHIELQLVKPLLLPLHVHLLLKHGATYARDNPHLHNKLTGTPGLAAEGMHVRKDECSMLQCVHLQDALQV